VKTKFILQCLDLSPKHLVRVICS